VEAYFEYFESCDFSRQNTNIETIRCIRVYVWFKDDQTEFICKLFLARRFEFAAP
jgi:hypothetical protein